MPCTCIVLATAHHAQLRRLTHIHQTEAGGWLLLLVLQPSRKGSRRAARVHEELIHVFESIKSMRPSPAQDIHIQSIRFREEQVGFGGHQGEAFEKPDPDAAVGDHLRQRERRSLDVEAALDDFEVRRDGSQILVRVLVREVSQAESLADLARGEQLLELRVKLAIAARRASTRGCSACLGRDVKCSIGDVHVPDNEDEERHDVPLCDLEEESSGRGELADRLSLELATTALVLAASKVILVGLVRTHVPRIHRYLNSGAVAPPTASSHSGSLSLGAVAIRIFFDKKIGWGIEITEATAHRNTRPESNVSNSTKMATPSLAEKLDKIKSPGLQSQKRVSFRRNLND